MKIGIHAQNQKQSPEELIQRCKDIGVDGVCLDCSVIDEFEEKGVPNTDHLHRLLDGLRDAGFEVPTVLGARYSDAMFQGEPEGEKEREALYRTIEVLTEAGVGSMLFWAISSASEDAAERRKLRDSGYTGMICPEHLGPASPGDDREARAVAFLRDTLAE